VVVVEGVEGVEEFFLALFSFPQELDVIDNQNVGGSELALEFGEFAVFDCAYEAIDKFLAAMKTNGGVRELVFCFVRDGMEQMCFSEPDVSIKEERIVCVSG